jgi:hypothetical protein
MSWKRLGTFGFFLVVVVLAATGCGGGAKSTVSSNNSPSTQFIKKDSNNPIPTFGKEAPAKELEAADAVVVESLKAREAANFARQCETLSLKAIQEVPNAKSRTNCAAALREFAQPLSASKPIRQDDLWGSIAVFRVKGNRGYALFHGKDGSDQAVPLEKEGGSWKVASIQTIRL